MSLARPRSRSWLSETTSSMRASGRSVLLTSRMTGSLASSALRSTNRVCGSGPSLASTSRTDAVDHAEAALDLATEVGVAGGVDHVDGDRAVAAWTPLYETAVFLARIVMPFSRSRSLESIARSSRCSWAAEGVRLAEHGVDQSGLAMVDVGDDRHVAQVGFRVAIAIGIVSSGNVGKKKGGAVTAALHGKCTRSGN
jgi:hypothetical protein